jgi:hypothetical protein
MKKETAHTEKSALQLNKSVVARLTLSGRNSDHQGAHLLPSISDCGVGGDPNPCTSIPTHPITGTAVTL